MVMRDHSAGFRMDGQNRLGMAFGKTIGIDRQRQHLLLHKVKIAVCAFTRKVLKKKIGQDFDIRLSRLKDSDIIGSHTVCLTLF